MKVRNIKLKFLVFIIISAFTHHTFAQHLQIDTLFLFRNEKAGALDNQKLKFPIVISGHKKIDALINADIKNRFTKLAWFISMMIYGNWGGSGFYEGIALRK